jgi:hypothetical protein
VTEFLKKISNSLLIINDCDKSNNSPNVLTRRVSEEISEKLNLKI